MLDILEHVGTHGARCCCFVCRKPYEVVDRFVAKQVHAGDQCEVCKNLPKNEPTQSLLHQVYDYNWDTGKLTYKRDFAKRHKGEDPTTLLSNGYLAVTLDKMYLAHRIVWLMQTGEFTEFVDHLNHKRDDNSWNNLRHSSRLVNAQNKSINLNNTTGYLGVSYMKRTGRYRAYINVAGKPVHLGLFTTAEEAYQVRLAAEKQYGFHENHGKQ